MQWRNGHISAYLTPHCQHIIMMDFYTLPTCTINFNDNAYGFESMPLIIVFRQLSTLDLNKVIKYDV